MILTTINTGIDYSFAELKLRWLHTGNERIRRVSGCVFSLAASADSVPQNFRKFPKGSFADINYVIILCSMAAKLRNFVTAKLRNCETS